MLSIVGGERKEYKMNKVKKFFYSQKAAPYVFVLPFVLTVLLFWIFPIGNGVLLSFQDVLKDKWVGLKNYDRLLSDKIFLKAVWNSVKYMIGTCALLIPFPLLFASLLNSKLMKKPGFFKSIYFLPALTSVVVAGTIFRLIFGEMDTALANRVIEFFGHSPIKWLKGQWTGYFALLLVACWRWTGVNILYFLAGLQSISTDLYEAASIDGASKWQQFKKNLLPSCKTHYSIRADHQYLCRSVHVPGKLHVMERKQLTAEYRSYHCRLSVPPGY